MRFVMLLIGMCILAWIVMTEFKTAKVVGVDGAPSGTPKEILQQTQQRVEKANALEEKRADQATNAALGNVTPAAVPVDEP